MVSDSDIVRLENLINKTYDKMCQIEDMLNKLAPESESAPLKKKALSLQSAISPPEVEAATAIMKETSYSTGDVASYLGTMLKDFNTKNEDSNAKVDYMISSMDVDLKTQVYNDDNQLRMSGANVSAGENGVSSVKISIKAVPKTK